METQKYREELVGKRFLTVGAVQKLNSAKISEWGWKAGVIRAATHKENENKELQVLPIRNSRRKSIRPREIAGIDGDRDRVRRLCANNSRLFCVQITKIIVTICYTSYECECKFFTFS